jgi:hypothetical protein
MFIAFEGPDNVGKSTSAAKIAYNGEAIYNITKHDHEALVLLLAEEPYELPVTYDRIDWFTHMVYRLALPDRDWNDERPRTVFAMPETHLVVKIHHPQLAEYISDELYAVGTLAQVNPLYYHFAKFFMELNRERGYSLFRTVSIVEVFHRQDTGEFTQRLLEFDSPATSMLDVAGPFDSDESLIPLFLHDEQRRLGL